MAMYSGSFQPPSSAYAAHPPPYQVHPDPAPAGSFTLRAAKHDSDVTLVRVAGSPKDAPALFSVAISHKKPHVVLTKGDPSIMMMHNAVAGHATFHKVNYHKVDLTIYGQQMRMKMSQMSGNLSIETPKMGKLKWKTNKLSGSPAELYDRHGRQIASVKSAGFFSSEKKLEILVPCDEFLLALVVLTAVTSKKLTASVLEAAAEIGAAAGGG